jgi:superfamily II DNA or RNA helicase
LWLIVAEPHVMVRVKRLFGRVQASRTGGVMVTDTAEIARDLQWLLDRYPLQMDDATRTRLDGQGELFRAREEAIVRILDGGRVQDLREPARPAREYQRIAADLAITTGRLLCTDELGLGKSMVGTLVLRAPNALPALVVCPTHLPKQWEREIAVTLPWLRTHTVTKATPYDPTTRRGVTEQPDVLIMSYSKLRGWRDHLAGTMRTVVFDEAQELRRNGTEKWTAAAAIADGAGYRVGLTHTPIYNYGGEIHNIMSILAPDALGTREEFLREWGSGDPYDDKGKVKDPASLGAYLREQGLMLGRTRTEVGRELPDVLRVPQEIDADPDALDRIAGDAAEMARLILAADTDRNVKFRLAGQLDWKMREATGIAKAPFVAGFVRLLLESEKKVLLLGWHRAVYDVWMEQLREFNPVLYTGSESPLQKARHAEDFISGDSRVLVMSLRSAAGLDGLQEACRVAVFGELDWSPQVHEQAIGRLHRDGQTDPVLAYFLHTDSGSDPAIVETLQIKRGQSEPMMSTDGKLFAQTVDNGDRIRRLAESVLTGKVRPVPAVAPDPVRPAELPSLPLHEPAQLTLLGAP